MHSSTVFQHVGVVLESLMVLLACHVLVLIEHVIPLLCLMKGKRCILLSLELEHHSLDSLKEPDCISIHLEGLIVGP